jgi:hypothetical protein
MMIVMMIMMTVVLEGVDFIQKSQYRISSMRRHPKTEGGLLIDRATVQFSRNSPSMARASSGEHPRDKSNILKRRRKTKKWDSIQLEHKFTGDSRQ